MKLSFFKSIGWFQSKSLPLLVGLILSPLAVMATDSGYTNTTTIIYEPGYSGNTVQSIQVDATNFVNYGTWDIVTYYAPYRTANTLNYINEGTMWGAMGWDFALYPSVAGQPGMSASFFNDSPGTIQAVDISIPNPLDSGNSYSVSKLWISATNIVNKGTLIAGAGGEIVLTGTTNVDLTRSHLMINGISRSGSSNGDSNYVADTSIYDEYWGGTNTFPSSSTPYVLDSSNLWNGASFASPTFYVSALCGVSEGISIPAVGRLVPTFSDSTNIIALPLTNIPYWDGLLAHSNRIQNVPAKEFRQAVFVYAPDPNIIASNRFLPTGDTSNLFQTVTVRLTNTVSRENLYLVDTLASSTNRGVLKNLNNVPGSNPQSSCTDPTYRPANYNLFGGAAPASFTNGFPGLGKPPVGFLYTNTLVVNGLPSSFSNVFVQAEYAGYSAFIDDLIRNSSGVSATNLPGRIIIRAGNLNLGRAVIASQGSEIVLQATHLVDSTNAVVTCQNLSYDLGSTNGYLNLTNLVNNTPLPGFNGTISAFSALWTNAILMILTNNFDTNTSFTVEVPITNSIEMDFHVLIVDASGLSSTIAGGTAQDLILHSTNAPYNITVGDPVNAVHTLLFDCQSLTLLKDLTLSSDLQNWSHANAPTLRYFTNNGTLTIPQTAHFGDDGTINYAAFVNNGVIDADSGGMTINSDYFQNSGTLGAAGGIFVITTTGKVKNASISSLGNVDFTGGALGLTNSTITIGNHLNFNMTNALYDGGPASANLLTCENGFSLLSGPSGPNAASFVGDFLGTTLVSETAGRAEIDHVWAGVDRGDTAAGFSNNVAIYTLRLTDLAIPSDPMEEPLFVLRGTSTIPGVTNAMYVNNLDISGLTEWDNEIQVDPNLVIYFISVSGASSLQLTTTFPGRFIQSSVITPHGYVPSPFIQSPRLSASASDQQFQLTVNGTAGQTYVVEASADLVHWVPISTNIAQVTGPFLLQFVDPSASYPTRFYRVVTP